MFEIHENSPTVDTLEENILFISSPNIGILFPRPFSDISMGAEMVIAGMKSEGLTCTYFDANASIQYNRTHEHKTAELYHEPVYSREKLSEDEFRILMTPDGLKGLISGEIQSERLHRWADYAVDSLLESCGDVDDYGAICLSLDMRLTVDYPSLISFGFCLFLLNKIREKTVDKNIPSYIGGWKVLQKVVERGLLKTVIEQFPEEYLPTVFFVGPGDKAFPKYLKENLEIDRKKEKRTPLSTGYGDTSGKIPYDHLHEEQMNNLIKEIDKDTPVHYGNGENIILRDHLPGVTKGLAVLSKNNKQSRLIPQYFYTQDMFDKFPELHNAKPFSYANYKFTEGCIFKCSFCVDSLLDDFEKNEMNDVIEALKYYNDNGVHHVRFFNNNINFKKSWLIELCNRIVRENIKVKWSDSANLRVTSQEMFDAMGESGCIKLWFGTETISPRILKQIRKEVSVEQMEKSLQWAHNSGIWNQCNFIVNFPWETEEEHEMLVDFVKRNFHRGILNGFQLNIFKLFRKTEYYEYPERFNIDTGVRKSNRNENIYTEIGGRDWDQIVEDGKYRYKNFLKQTDMGNSGVYVADHMFFSIHDIYNGDKEKIRTFLDYFRTNTPAPIHPFPVDPGEDIYDEWYEQNLKLIK